ncbi:MAG: hypothetical protein JJT89_18190 [Nitriliruptoraceae bacterium]|nr:hypothetical protein [Nitriliruptoraceae bacterium]
MPGASPHAARRRRHRTALATGALAVAIAACSGDGTMLRAEPEPVRTLDVTSTVSDGGTVNAEELEELAFEVRASMDDPGASPDLRDLQLEHGGEPVTDVEVADDTLRWAPGQLEDGEHEVRLLSVPVPDEPEDGEGDGAEDGAAADGDGDDTATDDGQDADAEVDEDAEVIETWRFTVDAIPPEITLTSPDGAVVAGDELLVAGTTEPGATVAIGSDEVVADAEGNFELTLDTAPEGELALVATDEAGNTSDAEVSLITVPSRATVDEIRSVHVSFCGWAASSLREPVMELIDAGLINAVQLDLKDETGKVGFDTQNEFAERIGSNTPDCRVNLEAAIEELHGLGVPVIGRVVAFADPVLAQWAFENGEEDLAVQDENGGLYTGRYAGFGNFANDEVVEYNIAIAEEAAAMGVDHILWDYIRKPDGSSARFPGLGDTDPQDAIVEFTRLAHERISPFGAEHGASLYGISADRPSEVAQNVPRMSEYLDYVAPMTYPSHWGPGEYGVGNPLMQPYDIMEATLEVWLEAVEGTDTRIVPWLEDSQYPISLGFDSRERYLREQIDATYDAGINEWILWDSAVRYTSSGMRLPD